MGKLKVALQLYSIRDEMGKNIESALRAVKEIGYDYVEFAGYFGLPAKTIKKLLNRYELECISVHQGYEVFLSNPEQSIEYLKTIGAKYCAIPWMDEQKHAGHPVFIKTVEELTQVGKLLKENSIQLLYHNHDFEFKIFEEKFLLDWLYEKIPSDLLQTEIDTCWVLYAGHNPSQYIEKYTGRSPIVHLKDFVSKNFNMGPAYNLIDEHGNEILSDNKEKKGFEFKPLGQGVQNVPSVLEATVKAGAEIVVVEQDMSLDRPSIESAKLSREYLKSLGL